jgi:hypothetical protein
VICWKGKVLAGISVEAVEVSGKFGPASVVRVIEHPGMTRAADQVVRRLSLSGFVGFDFVLDFSGQAWLIEMNPRVTPICHLSVADSPDLAGALYTQMTGVRPMPKGAAMNHNLVALFPNEIVRSASSEYLYLQSCQHDVPWNEPELVRTAMNQALRPGLYRCVRKFLVSALIKLGRADARRAN